MVVYERHEREGTGADLSYEAVLAEALAFLDLAEYCDETHAGAPGTGLDLDTRQIVKQAVSILRRRKLPWERNPAPEPAAAAASDAASDVTKPLDYGGQFPEAQA
jgi:hypothetical protein